MGKPLASASLSLLQHLAIVSEYDSDTSIYKIYSYTSYTSFASALLSMPQHLPQSQSMIQGQVSIRSMPILHLPQLYSAYLSLRV